MKSATLALALSLGAATGFTAVLRPDGTVDWTRYHNSDDAETLLRELATRYPDLAKMYSIGKSLQGKELWMLELTNRKLKPAEEKPGYYVDGGIHSCELAGAEQVLYLAWYFATKHGAEPAVTRLLDTRTLYLRPKFNPDGADYCLTHPDSLRSTVRPWDDDGDGQFNEDGVGGIDMNRNFPRTWGLPYQQTGPRARPDVR